MSKVRYSNAQRNPVPQRAERLGETFHDKRAISLQSSAAVALRTGQFDPHGLSAEAILVLQRSIGNRAVGALLQPSSPRFLQRAPSPNPGPTVTPIVDPVSDAPSKGQPPKVAWVSKQRQSAEGKNIPDSTRMRVGELLVVRVGIDHVEPAALRRMGSMIVTDALTKESFDVEDTGTVQVKFRATKVGTEHAAMRFTPAGAVAPDELSVLVETHVEMGKEEFRGQLQEASQYVNNAYHAANLFMTRVSPPYREGWENAKKTLDKAGEGDPFDEIVIHLVLTFLSGLAGGEVEQVLEHLKQGKVLTEGLKEVAIHAVEAGSHAAMPKASVSLPQDPADWVDACHQQIETEELAVGAMLEEMIKANNDDRAGFFRDFDVVAAVHDALTFNGQPMRSLETAAIPTAEDFERMIWKGWLVGWRGVPDVFDADAWLVIIHRLDDLGENGDEFVRTYLTEGYNLEMKKGSDK
jgi:hypothetical protein